MKADMAKLRELILGMREAYFRGENAMDYARRYASAGGGNEIIATLIAYDLQAGTYKDFARNNSLSYTAWCAQLASLISCVLPRGGSLLEVGTGEATTLSGVIRRLSKDLGHVYGVDLSWSRIHEGMDWLEHNSQQATLFVGDLFNIPLADGSVDVVFSSHSIEPNGGREREAIAECLRVARTAVVLVEPIYELAGSEARERMEKLGYVRNLKAAADKFSVEIRDYRLLDYCNNPLNPSGVLTLLKTEFAKQDAHASALQPLWQCPLTGASLVECEDCMISEELGIAYPKLRGVPLLSPDHMIIASKYPTQGRKAC